MPRINSKSFAVLLIPLLLLIALRLYLMGSLPLADTTEARYAELARVTATGGFWLMPHITPDQPFFAKPPLSTWFAAGSWLAFGKNELAVRLPSLALVLMSCLAMLYGAASFKLTSRQWLFASLVILTTPIGFISAGAVMTDATQLAIVSWAMVFLWRIIQNQPAGTGSMGRLEFDQYGLWLMLGLGAIAKGLATWILIGLPMMLFWLTLPKEAVFSHIRKIWFWPGILVFLCVVLAWYIPAEIYYPGFLKYFIIGEHFQRFLEPGWKGDMYGSAHREAIGTIWVYWVMSTTVWLPVFIYKLKKDRPLINKTLDMEKKWLWAWILAPLIFFTFSRNIIWTYTLTAIPAFSILVASSWPTLGAGFRKIMVPAIALWLVLMFVTAFTWFTHLEERKSARKLVHVASLEYPGRQLYSYGTHEFSVSYYTNGQVKYVEDKKQLGELLSVPDSLIILNTAQAKSIENNRQGKILGINGTHALLITNQ